MISGEFVTHKPLMLRGMKKMKSSKRDRGQSGLKRVSYHGSFAFWFHIKRPETDYWWREAFNHRTVSEIQSDVYVDL